MVFVSSVHKFTDPIREFKENDPYAYWVDNIPLKQVHRNTLWLKDQLNNISSNQEVGRRNFVELKPYVSESDNIVRVLPGRFIARINDAYRRTILQNISIIHGASSDSAISNLTPDQVEVILEKIKSSAAADALQMNGMAERILSWPVKWESGIHATAFDSGLDDTTNLPKTITFNPLGGLHWPSLGAIPFFKQFFVGSISENNTNLISTELIKHWRGVVRTAVVDVPNEITLEIDPFDAADFFYINEAGVKTTIPGAVNRIDLVFIYSKPIDTSSTTINKWDGGTPQNILSPVLGVVKGAGLGLDKNKFSKGVFSAGVSDGDNVKGDYEQGPSWYATKDGSKILPNVADQSTTTNGFQNSAIDVHGSFPSPDDLLNLAPVLAGEMEENNFHLIGQSILPVCYIVVRSDSTTTSEGKPVLREEDILDIRPFFRTTELSYTERAGLAMAEIPISPDNWVIGRRALENALTTFKSTVLDPAYGVGGGGGTGLLPQVVAGGIIWGGRAFGPEGAVDNILGADQPGGGGPTSPFPVAPHLPDWDLADWWDIFPGTDVGTTVRGNERNDYVNQYGIGLGDTFDGGAKGFENPSDDGFNQLGTEAKFGNRLPTVVYWCKKEILFDKSQVTWMQDYDVRLQLEHCFPLTSRPAGPNVMNTAGGASLWVEKKQDRFIIYASWIASDGFLTGDEPAIPGGGEPRQNRTTTHFSGWLVRYKEMGNGTNNMEIAQQLTSGPKMAACTYPTVSFQIIGYPAGKFHDVLGGNSPQIVLG